MFVVDKWTSRQVDETVTEINDGAIVLYDLRSTPLVYLYLITCT